MATPGVSVKDRRDGFPIFIHSELDDYGLSNAEFRVYARLARRAGESGFARESVPKMATAFMVSDKTVRRCLQLLRDCRLITEKLKPGRPTIYTLNPRNVWLDKKQLPTIRATIYGTTLDTTTPGCDVHPDMRDGGGWTSGTGAPWTPQTDEGYPVEGNPKKDIPISQPPFFGAEFIEALTEFEQHRKEKRIKVTPTARSRLFKKLERWGEERATAALIFSTEQGYTGVFEENSNGTNKPRYESSSERSVRNLRESAEYIRGIPESDGPPDRQDAIGLLVADTGRTRAGSSR